jgi:hypothetical protein
LNNHKESWWNTIIKYAFESFKGEENEVKKAKISKTDKNERVTNHRKLYEFAESKHSNKPAEIEVGKPHDLNPS